MTIPSKYINRDISWLSFNLRVLEEAKDKSLPIYERLKFLAIYSSNLDEFYKVRVSEYRNAAVNGKPQTDIDNSELILEEINAIVTHHWLDFSNILKTEILPELKKNNLILLQEAYPTHPKQLEFIKNLFFTELIPFLQPVVLLRGTRSFLRDNRLYLAIKLYSKQKAGSTAKRKARYAMLKLPTNDYPRFIKLPKVDDNYYYMYLDDTIRLNLHELFPGYDIEGSWCVKLGRDADLGIDNEQVDLIEKIRKNLKKRKVGKPAAFQYDRTIPKDVLHFLMDIFNFKPLELVEAGRYQNLNDFFTFPNPFTPKLEWQVPTPIKPVHLEQAESMFQAIKHSDLILHYPYHSFDYLIKFLNEAAIDPKVEEILVTQYRVASNSEVVGALIGAARNNKKVSVFVEVQARFDEANNLYFAELMEKAGIEIIYSIPGLKVHAKMALVIRRYNGVRKRSFAYLSTGNFNEKTAKTYADHGFFTCKDSYLEDMENLFRYLKDQTIKPNFNKLLVTRVNFRETIMQYIDKEIELAKAGKKAYILLKMNGIQNRDLIDKLYEAGQAGVKIDLILRGICCLVPNQSFSKNIRVVRLVDSFLEHARIWVFGNDGDKTMYLSSADWLNRNINRRIETAFPIEEPHLKDELWNILQLQLSDNVKARNIDENMNNLVIKNNLPPIRAQVDTYSYLCKINEERKINPIK